MTGGRLADQPRHQFGRARDFQIEKAQRRQEKAAIKKVVASSRFVLPVHDRPALIEAGQVVGRLQDAVPGPVVQSLPRRNWFPA